MQISQLSRPGHILILLALWGVPTVLSAQDAAIKSSKLDVTAVVGCVVQDGANWVLANATGPLLAPTRDGKAQTGSTVTVEQAKGQRAGKERYRLLGLLDEFGVPEHKGHRVLAKGLVVGGPKDRRINLVAFSMVAPTC